MKRDSNGCELDKNGDKTWKNSAGQLHRADGPAIERANGTKEWWYKGKRITKKEYYSKNFQVKICDGAIREFYHETRSKWV